MVLRAVHLGVPLSAFRKKMVLRCIVVESLNSQCLSEEDGAAGGG